MVDSSSLASGTLSWSHIVAPPANTAAADSVESTVRDLSRPSTEEGDVVLQPDSALENKPAWNVPSTGSMKVNPEIDASMWPALSASCPFSKSSLASSKSSSSDSLKGLSDGSASARTGSMASTSSSSKLNMGNPKLNVAPPSRLPVSAETPTIVSGTQAVQHPPPRGSSNSRSSDQHGRAFQPQPYGGNDHRRSYGGNRRENYNGGGGSHYHFYGRRHDLERRGYEGNHQNFQGRDVHLHGPRGMHPRPLPLPLFVPPPAHFQPYLPIMAPPGFRPVYYRPIPPHPEMLMGVPPVARPPPYHMIHLPMMDPQSGMIWHRPAMPLNQQNPQSGMAMPQLDGVLLNRQDPQSGMAMQQLDGVLLNQPDPQSGMAMQQLDGVPLNRADPELVNQPDPEKLLKQIEFYFSKENLCKDTYLRTHMDDEGWVFISFVAGFKLVMALTTSMEEIKETLQLSTVVEVQGEKMRRKNDWLHWLLPPGFNHYDGSAPQP